MLKATLSSYEFGTFEVGKSRTVRIYNENDSPFDASGYSAVVIIQKEGIKRLQDIPISWTTQNQGIGIFELTSTNTFSSEGIYELLVWLTQSGKNIPTRPVRIMVWRLAQ